MEKSLKILFILVIIFFSFNSSFSQLPTYTLTAKNFNREAPDSLTFDVYLLHTNSGVTNFEYSLGQYFFTFNTAISNGGTLTYRIINSDLPTAARPRNPSISGNELRLASNSVLGAGNGPAISNASSGTLIVRMSLKTSVGSFAPNQPLNLAWKNTGSFFTRIYAYVGTTSTEITTPASHFIDSNTISISQISSKVPAQYNIFQNYPNPFNPTTKIKFDIPKLSNVQLTVFDVTGKEVEVLVNDKLSPGSYEYVFDAGKQSSGVYFYRIQTDDYIETKRMMLLK